LTKVAFGCRDFDALANRIAVRSIGGQLRVATRMRPKRAPELVGGNLYWIVKQRLIGCNEIVAIDDRSDGRVDIVCVGVLKRVTPVHRRAHQGWRYLVDEDAPTGEADSSGLGELPPGLYGRLAALALV
jgi:hypothetical protein